jgi:hypothetical protein
MTARLGSERQTKGSSFILELESETKALRMRKA